MDVVDVYQLLAELSLLTGRLPQLFRQLEQLVDDLVEVGDVVIVDGPNTGDPAAVGAIAGHWLAAASGAADELARRVDQAQQALTWAANHPALTHLLPSRSSCPLATFTVLFATHSTRPVLPSSTPAFPSSTRRHTVCRSRRRFRR